MLNSHFKKLHSVATSYATTLRQCMEASNLRKVTAIHAKLAKTSRLLSHSLFAHNHLVNAYVKTGDVWNGLKLFDEMPEKNVATWTILIAGLVQKGFPAEAISLFPDMHRSEIRPNEFTFVSLLHACSSSASLDLTCSLQVYALIIRLGFESNVYLVNAFLTSLVRHDRLDEAIKLFNGCFHKDVVTWNAMLDGLLKFSCEDIPRFWHRMTTEGIKPDEFTLATILTGLADLSDLEMGLQVHALVVKSGHGREVCLGNALADMYLKSQRLDHAFRAFDEIPIKDVYSWTQMAAGCLNCGEPVKTLRVFSKMRKVGVKPNRFTFTTGLNACANLVNLDEGQKIQGLTVKIGEEVDTCVDNALLDMYAKCGCMDGASRVFRLMAERSVVSWTTMIGGLSQNGHCEKALELFEQMRLERVEPNYITFICVLYACSLGGFIDKGLEYFSCMREEYGIDPGEDHFACAVSLLGRAGRIEEAEKLILEMPMEAGIVVWQTLLGACRMHGDVGTAKRVAEKAFNIDEKDPSTYVLLSNMFADFENWKSAGKVRKSIVNRDIKKMPGSSWLEANKGIWDMY